MKIGIYNSSFENSAVAGISAGVLARALGRDHETEIIEDSSSSIRESFSSFDSKLIERVAFRKVDDSPRFVTDPTRPERRYQALRDWSDELTRRYDLFINFTDRLPIYCAAKRGVLVIQFPYDFIPTFYRTFWLEHLASYQLKLANSYYTRFWTQLFWELDCAVVHPPVTNAPEPAIKENLILTVGSFNPTRSDAQLELISAFDQLRARMPDWSFSMIGDVDNSWASRRYFERVREAGSHSGVTVLANAPGSEQAELIKRSRVFWHAAGVAGDLDLQPHRAEPFNLPVVQAMAAGCIPVVTNAGGLSEIIRQNENGLFWNTRDELIDYTLKLAADESRRLKMAKASQRRALDFRPEQYIDSFLRRLRNSFGIRHRSRANPLRIWKRFINSTDHLRTSRR